MLDAYSPALVYTAFLPSPTPLFLSLPHFFVFPVRAPTLDCAASFRRLHCPAPVLAVLLDLLVALAPVSLASLTAPRAAAAGSLDCRPRPAPAIASLTPLASAEDVPAAGAGSCACHSDGGVQVRAAKQGTYSDATKLEAAGVAGAHGTEGLIEALATRVLHALASYAQVADGLFPATPLWLLCCTGNRGREEAGCKRTYCSPSVCKPGPSLAALAKNPVTAAALTQLVICAPPTSHTAAVGGRLWALALAGPREASCGMAEWGGWEGEHYHAALMRCICWDVHTMLSR